MNLKNRTCERSRTQTIARCTVLPAGNSQNGEAAEAECRLTAAGGWEEGQSTQELRDEYGALCWGDGHVLELDRCDVPCKCTKHHRSAYFPTVEFYVLDIRCIHSFIHKRNKLLRHGAWMNFKWIFLSERKETQMTMS